MSTEADRRAQGASRIPFEGLVEVGGARGPSFEAQAVNVSEEGMQLRTAYLPEIGQPLTCRFDAEPGQSVMASGEVVWASQEGKAGEFGIRFTDLDAESVESLRRMIGVAPGMLPQAPGTKVRLHIEGLASPMRARVKTSKNAQLTVGSDLSFLQVGKELDLEDAESGGKRPAKIDGVSVEVDAASHVPQLVVKLRYSDVGDAALAPLAPEDEAPPPIVPRPPKMDEPHVDDADDIASVKKASGEVKGAMARGMAKIGPAFSTFAGRAKNTIAAIAAKRGGDDGPPQQRRTTAPAPGGGLHTSGRKVIRGNEGNGDSQEEANMPPRFKMTKRKIAILGAAVLAIALAVIALNKKGSTTPAMASPNETSTSKPAHASTSKQPIEPPAAMNAAPAAPIPGSPQVAAAGPNEPSAAPPAIETAPGKKDKHGNKKVTPFGAAVAHPNVLAIKMDGAIEKIQGAAQPNGFTVQIPGRKSVEAAGPLAQKDPRIASIKVTNDGTGAELTIQFKDGVPKYQVRAKGDTLEIALAPVGKGGDKKVAKKEKGTKKSGGKKNPKNEHPEKQPHH